MHDDSWKDDYDFPMSWTFWRDICRQHGFDPGDNELPEEPNKTSEPLMERGLYWQQQVEAERINVRKKLAEALLEIERLRAKVDRSSKDIYIYNTIKEKGSLPNNLEAK